MSRDVLTYYNVSIFEWIHYIIAYNSTKVSDTCVLVTGLSSLMILCNKRFSLLDSIESFVMQLIYAGTICGLCNFMNEISNEDSLLHSVLIRFWIKFHSPSRRPIEVQALGLRIYFLWTSRQTYNLQARPGSSQLFGQTGKNVLLRHESSVKSSLALNSQQLLCSNFPKLLFGTLKVILKHFEVIANAINPLCWF